MQRLERHFRKLTRTAFERHGFAYADILCQWPVIAGSTLATVSSPERIRWPGRKSTDKRGGTLVIRASAGHALDLHHETRGIMERVNGFFGYEAVTSVKIINDLRMSAAPATSAAQEHASVAKPETLSQIGDPELKSALLRLAAGVGK